jgi:hypothetical protein
MSTLARGARPQQTERARTLGGIARYRERTGWVRGTCTLASCRRPIEGGFRLWCSEACATVYKIANDTKFAREQVRLRDAGVCAACGVDTEATKRSLYALARDANLAAVRQRGADFRVVASPEARAASRALWDALRAAGVPAKKGADPEAPVTVFVAPHLWEADHVVEVVRGGDTTLANLATLCLPCHKAKTKALAAARATKEPS